MSALFFGRRGIPQPVNNYIYSQLNTKRGTLWFRVTLFAIFPFVPYKFTP